MEATRHNDPISLWAPRRQLTLAQARRRSERVRYLRYGFVAAAAAAIGLFTGYIVRSAISQEAAPPPVDDSQAVTMINPRFTGRDAAGEIFTITAEAAQRRRARDGAVDLVSPVLRDSKGTEVKAPSGYYDRNTGILELYEDVRISDAAGYMFNSQGARLHVSEDRVEGLSPLEGRGPLGDIKADSYEILDGGDRIVFKGNVQTVIYPSKADNSAGTREGDENGTP
ncbi:LPS export ABC transporter periplasmic protein LptC [Hyphomonas sp. WL0036]|uniref:LPS export ABC transporter periplasmic protein LptC n=1 Tax=Hyphomonas sediminis TaxID=2866160 RepID=UPI001C7EEF7D|nr:LPS export ABC transporter periplasmic protein LptC [Hyphomonas sediminis]MBY9066237.1 LPS export ABC transporter periplasmic protein LptC [Hyphomonas sediminis]